MEGKWCITCPELPRLVILYKENISHINTHNVIILAVTGSLTAVFFVAVIGAVVIVVAPPDGRYTPFVVALKLSILTLISGWKKKKKKQTREDIRVQMDDHRNNMFMDKCSR